MPSAVMLLCLPYCRAASADDLGLLLQTPHLQSNAICRLHRISPGCVGLFLDSHPYAVQAATTSLLA